MFKNITKQFIIKKKRKNLTSALVIYTILKGLEGGFLAMPHQIRKSTNEVGAMGHVICL